MPVIPKKRMASIEAVILSKDPEVIKKKRSTIQRFATGVRNNLDRLLVKTAGKFDHAKIERLEVQIDHSSLKKHFENFQVIHEGYIEYRAEGKDATAEDALVLQDENHYQEVKSKIFESLQLLEDYEESFQIYKAALPNPDLAKKEAEERSSKEALAKQLKQEEELQRQEAEASSKAEEEKIRKELRAQVVKTKLVFKESIGMYRTAKKYAEEMTRFARELSKEEVVMGRLLHKIRLIKDMNAHPIWGVELNPRDPTNVGTENIGQGLYTAIASFFNSDCNPNTIRINMGTQMFLVASKNIRKGEEITDNYCIHFSDVPAAERRGWIEVESRDEMSR